eukprot:205112_1
MAETAVGIVDTWIPEKLVMRGIKLMIGIYGFIGVICIVLVLMYCIDYYASTVWDTYPRFDGVFLWIIISLNTLGALIGFYGTFKFGPIDEQMEDLEKQNENLQKELDSVDNEVTDLNQSITSFEEQIGSIISNEHDLNAQITAFTKLENALKAEARSNNTEIVNFLKEVQTLFTEFKKLQTQVEKANLLNLFYELEFRGDDEEGLSKSEFKIFMSRLDKQTAANFNKTFEEMDLNGDGTIDLNEFQRELEDMYDKINTKIEVGEKGKKKKKK